MKRQVRVGGDERRGAAQPGTGLLPLVRRRPWAGLLLALLGLYLVARSVSGYRAMSGAVRPARGRHESGSEPRADDPGRAPLEKGIKVEKAVTVNRPVPDVYAFWRRLENLPVFMHHIQSVVQTSERQSHWVARAPLGGIKLEWDAEITDDRPDELIAWTSLPGANVATAGSVRFREAPGHRGTEVRVTLAYTPPGGPAGAGFARLFNKITAQQIKEDLRRFKQVVEAGEAASVDGQSSGRQDGGVGASSPGEGGVRPAAVRHRQRDLVDEASMESFPASDPPAYSGGKT